VKRPKFEVGDVVRLKGGKLPLTVVNVMPFYHGARYHLTYNHNGSERNNECETNIVFYDQPANQPAQKENEMTLYEIKTATGTTFGTKLAVNSNKDWVMEEKGTGAVIVASPKDVSKVMPYTIGVKFSQDKQVYSYFAEKGKYSKGDAFLVNSLTGNFQIAIVDSVDTQSDQATKDFAPIAKLVTEQV
jgi:hypothetical protein